MRPMSMSGPKLCSSNVPHARVSGPASAADTREVCAPQGVTNFTDLSSEEFAAQYLSAPQAVPPPQQSTKQGRKSRCMSVCSGLNTCRLHTVSA